MFMDFKDYLIPNVLEEDVEFLPLMSLEDEQETNKENFADIVPILPLRNTVLFPGVVIPITVGRDKSIKAVKEAYNTDKIIGVISQKDSTIEEPENTDLNKIGTLAKIAKLIKMPDGSTTAIIQGRKRFAINEIISNDPYMKATINVLQDILPEKDKEFDALISTIKDLAGQIIKLSPNIPSEANIVLKNIDSSGFLINFIASNMNIDVVDKQKILEINAIKEKASIVLQHMNNELQMLELKNKIHTKVRSDIEKQQKEFFLHQQLKTIKEELGGDPFEQEIKELKAKAEKKKWNKQVAVQFEKEITKLQRMNPAAAEYSVVFNYLELLLDLPWGEYTKDNFNLKRAKKVLNEDHYGLEKIKERILEYLAVLKLKGDLKSPILCFVGPPGVGKTSLGETIAKALDRKYVRMSLGGLHDESEIRGHRKTYIGAMPGRIIQSLKKVESSNPVFVLDEIDKVGKDFRGDPSSALLEVLDPQQNATFYDNFLETEYDLSKVLFVATANDLNAIQPALRDRMEIIYLGGYSVEEKTEIAKRHLIDKQLNAHGLKASQVKFSDQIIHKIIKDYTRESGVRELERKIASIFRNIAKKVALNEKYTVQLKEKDILAILKLPPYDNEKYQQGNPPGVAVGLAWTSVGGDILFIETSINKGKGNLTVTGNLGDVMKESATTALSFIKAHADEYDIHPELFSQFDLHIHFPEGATPKDGPSAGIAILSALVSNLTQRIVRPYLAMTGEITLRGKVLAVGGIKEKVLAAKRTGIKEIILCKENKKDVEEINPQFIKGVKFHYVNDMNEVIQLSLEKKTIRNPKKFDIKQNSSSKILN